MIWIPSSAAAQIQAQDDSIFVLPKKKDTIPPIQSNAISARPGDWIDNGARDDGFRQYLVCVGFRTRRRTYERHKTWNVIYQNWGISETLVYTSDWDAQDQALPQAGDFSLPEGFPDIVKDITVSGVVDAVGQGTGDVWLWHQLFTDGFCQYEHGNLMDDKILITIDAPNYDPDTVDVNGWVKLAYPGEVVYNSWEWRYVTVAILGNFFWAIAFSGALVGLLSVMQNGATSALSSMAFVLAQLQAASSSSAAAGGRILKNGEREESFDLLL